MLSVTLWSRIDTTFGWVMFAAITASDSKRSRTVDSLAKLSFRIFTTTARCRRLSMAR